MGEGKEKGKEKEEEKERVVREWRNEIEEQAKSHDVTGNVFWKEIFSEVFSVSEIFLPKI